MVMLSYEILIALRHLKSRKQSHVISLLTLISLLGVMMGVWALTVVLSVLSGFGQDLKGKIVESTPDIVIERKEGDLTEYRDLCQRLRKTGGVTSCSAFLTNEVMLSSNNNTAGALLRGIERSASRIGHLTKQMKSGKFEHLFHPERIKVPRLFRLRMNLPSLHELDKQRDKFRQEKKAHQQARTRPPTSQSSRSAPPLPLHPPPLRAPPSSRPTSQSAAKALAEQGYGLLQLQKRNKRFKRYPSILLGQELAQNLSVVVGDVLRVVSPLGGSLTPMGMAPRIRKFRVAGIFFTGMYEYDTKFAFIALPSAQKLFKMYGAATGIELSVKDVYQTPQIKKDLREKKGMGLYRVRDWIELNSQLFGALQMEKIVMFVILIFIVLVASFNIVSTLFMIVVEKSQEIAILKSMGATQRGIMTIFMVEGVVIGVLGTVLGLFLGWRTCLFLLEHPIKMNTDVYYIATLPIQMNTTDFIAVAAASVLLSFLATIYPALQAAKMSPVEGLQHE